MITLADVSLCPAAGAHLLRSADGADAHASDPSEVKTPLNKASWMFMGLSKTFWPLLGNLVYCSIVYHNVGYIESR